MKKRTWILIGILSVCVVAYGALLTSTTIAGTLGVTGNTTVGGTLGVTGAATFDSTVAATGAVTGSNINATNWDTGYTDRLKWDGGATGLTAATGRTSLGLGTVATQAYTAINLDGGTIDGTTIGGTTPYPGTFTLVTGNTGVITTDLSVGGDLAVTGDITGANISDTEWDTAYDDRLKWDGGSTDLVAATGRTSLGLGTIATQAASAVSLTGGLLDGSFLFQVDGYATATDTAASSFWLTAPSGGTDSGSASHGRDGGDLTITSGSGSDAVTTGTAGGNAGNIIIKPGVGGNGEGAGDPGAAGTIILGNAASGFCLVLTDTSNADAADGIITAFFGASGNSSTSTDGGDAGMYIISSGDGGSSSHAGDDGGDGGSIYVYPGSGGEEGLGGNAGADGDVVINKDPLSDTEVGRLFLFNLPTSDPHVAGQVWVSTNTLMVSTG